MGNFSGWLFNFMQGRYGFDELGRHLGMQTIVVIIASVVCGVIATLVLDLTALVRLGAFLNLVAIFLNWASIALIIWLFYRVLSRNIEKRRAENERYLARREKRSKRHGKGGETTGSPGNPGRTHRAWNGSPNARDISRDAANYDYLICPFCGQKMRVPKGKGKIAVKCPSCGEKTIVNS